MGDRPWSCWRFANPAEDDFQGQTPTAATIIEGPQARVPLEFFGGVPMTCTALFCGWDKPYEPQTHQILAALLALQTLNHDRPVAVWKLTGPLWKGGYESCRLAG